MEKFDLSKHWDKFIDGKLTINCKTEEFANQFLSYCHSKNILWISDIKLTQHNNWDHYKEETTYFCEDMLMSFGRSSFYRKNYTVLEFDGIGNKDEDTYVHVKQPKPPLGVIPKNILELQRVQDLCRALYEYSTYEEVDYELMIKWSDELNDRLYGLKGDKLNKEIEDEDELWECL